DSTVHFVIGVHTQCLIPWIEDLPPTGDKTMSFTSRLSHLKKSRISNIQTARSREAGTARRTVRYRHTLEVLEDRAVPTQLLLNGDFDLGSLTGWTATAQGSGGFFASTPGTPTPSSGHATAGNPSGGTTYAVSDENGPSVHVLRQ